MNEKQKQLLIAGAILLVVSAIYIATSGIPNTQATAIAFPLSILGLFFGMVFIVWSAAWMGLEKTKLLK